MSSAVHKRLSADTSLILTGNYGAVNKLQCGYVCGAVFIADELLSPAQLDIKLAEAIKNDKLPNLLLLLNGFFYLVLHSQHQLFLCTDKLRSRPLFYIKQGPDMVISDSANALCDLNNNVLESCPLAVEEFYHTGYVTDSDTLLQQLKQVPAASIVRLSQQKVVSQQYFNFVPLPKAKALPLAVEQWFEPLDSVMHQCVARLIKYANGRQIIVPLSGGYDSRALAVYLKKSGYSNILCFAFGRPGSPELALSAKVADALALPWVKITYSRKEWQRFSKSAQFDVFLRFIHNKVSVPNIQVLLALHKLQGYGLITADAVFVPGHTADFVSGGHIPDITVSGDIIQQAYTATVKTHYALNSAVLSAALKHKLISQLEAIKQHWQVSTAEQLCEAWNFNERQAKFIVNSNRYYDFHQYDWWMPFWDNAFVNFWQHVPAELRVAKKLWINFVDAMMYRQTGTAITGNADVKASRWSARVHRYTEYWTDTNALFSLVPFSHWFAWRFGLSSRAGSVFSCLAGRCIAYLDKDSKNN